MPLAPRRSLAPTMAHDVPTIARKTPQMTLLCTAEQSTLLVIDPQARLMPSIHESEEVIRRCLQLATAARELRVHVIGTEENPAGLGPMVAALRALCDTTLTKFHFSAVDEPGFMDRMPHGRDTFVVVGCEAHVCVLQTVIGLLEAGHHVKWVADAIGSRHPHDRIAATARARALGADIVTTEMVLFEWLRTSNHPAFKKILQLVR
jgi:nicotinamidase-related amidase